ncbi:rCG46832 [Rattus norvegicus]|uniref:RCG46832 n=1 Tax=Rattus norvegicus TaxID=10116 RepID=A6IX78_RAT|nr:rCG46832 [Rattus norvegicus]
MYTYSELCKLALTQGQLNYFNSPFSLLLICKKRKKKEN